MTTAWQDVVARLRAGTHDAAALIEAQAEEIEMLREAGNLARAVLAQIMTAGQNQPAPTPEDINKAFWALDAASPPSRRVAMPDAPEIREKEDGTLDEVVAENAVVHLEQMRGNCWFLSVSAGGKRVGVWLSSKNKITASWETEDA